jgi:hypothetical protein
MIKPGSYGVMAEFESPSTLVNAARAATDHGFKKLDVYTPFPIEELSDILHLHNNRLPLIVLLGAIAGGLLGYLLQYFVTVIYFPINIGGRPLHSWPSYIIITFELTILLGCLSAVLGMLALCRLPMPHHPVFNVPKFESVSRDRFFLCIEAADPLFDVVATYDFLTALEAREVTEVAD